MPEPESVTSMHSVAVLAVAAHTDVAAFRRELQRVGQQVAQHLVAQSCRVGRHDARRRFLEGDGEADALLVGQHVERAVDPLEEVGHHHVLHLQAQAARFQAADVEQLVDQLCQAARLLLDGRQGSGLLLGNGAEHAVVDQLGIAGDHVDGRLQLVGGHAHELGLHAVQLGQALGHGAEGAGQVADLVGPVVWQAVGDDEFAARHLGRGAAQPGEGADDGLCDPRAQQERNEDGGREHEQGHAERRGADAAGRRQVALAAGVDLRAQFPDHGVRLRKQRRHVVQRGRGFLSSARCNQQVQFTQPAVNAAEQGVSGGGGVLVAGAHEAFQFLLRRVQRHVPAVGYLGIGKRYVAAGMTVHVIDVGLESAHGYVGGAMRAPHVRCDLPQLAQLHGRVQSRQHQQQGHGAHGEDKPIAELHRRGRRGSGRVLRIRPAGGWSAAPAPVQPGSRAVPGP
jgi:hypothetical protein